MSWKKVKLGSILTESKVASEFPDTNKRIKVRLKVLGVEKRGIENEVEGATKQFVRKAGQFIYGKQNFHKGAFGIVPKELDGFESSSDLPAFDVDKSCLPEFLFYFFKQGNYYLELSKIASGVATQRINTSQLFDLEIPLPEIEIQKTLLKNIKILENNGGEISSELIHQLELIKQLRQAFLREAMQGKLVKSTNTKETGQQLLTKIKAEKAQLIAEKKLKKEKELSPIIEDEIPFDIPEHWAWCRFGEMSINCDGARKPISQTERQHKDKIYNYYGASGIIDKIDGFTHHGKFLLIGEDGANLIAKSTPIAFIAEGKFWVNNHAHVLDFIDDITKIFMTYCLNTIDIKPFISGGFQPKLNQANLNLMQIPLPPLHEQEQIVAKLEDLMAFCEDLELSIKESQGYNEMLLQQVLREALQGNTVINE